MINKSWILRVTLFTGIAATTSHAETISAVADEWCPYNCAPGSATPGYVIEMMQEIFHEAGHKLDYRTVPWNRAVLDTKNNKETSVVCATESQAKEATLKIGKESIGVSNDCLWVAATSKIKFKIADDLNSLTKVGTVLGYSYSYELGKWLDRPENKGKSDAIAGDDPAERNAIKLVNKSIDGIIENRAVMTYILKKTGMDEQIRNAGCQEETAMYIAFSPNHTDSDKLVEMFDKGVVKLRKSGKLKKILTKYGVRDWKR
jgi:polar amino acid transport system substrate-binding protein